MKAEIKWIHSPDVEELSNYFPEDPENFCLFLQLMVGPAGQEGEESFNIEICTPKWLAEHYKKEDMVLGRHRLIVFEYNYKRFSAYLEKIVGNCWGDNWKEVAEKVARIGHWEFEDYTEFRN